MRGYTQLTQEERYQIYILKQAEYNQAQIAEMLERDKSTISRELRRNRGLRGYRPRQAHHLALARCHGRAAPRISHEWIYQYVYADKRSGGDLYRYLRCQKARRKRYGTYERRGCIPNQVSIDERPTIVDSKRRFGDWEGDTVIGKGHLGDAGRAQVLVYGHPICHQQDGECRLGCCRGRAQPVHRLGTYHHL